MASLGENEGKDSPVSAKVWNYKKSAFNPQLSFSLNRLGL